MNPAQLVDEAQLLCESRVGHPQGPACSADQLEIFHRRVQHDIRQRVLLQRVKMIKGVLGLENAHAGVQIGASQIRIHDHHLMTERSQSNAQRSGQHGFADSAFAAAHCVDDLPLR